MMERNEERPLSMELISLIRLVIVFCMGVICDWMVDTCPEKVVALLLIPFMVNRTVSIELYRLAMRVLAESHLPSIATKDEARVPVGVPAVIGVL